MLHSGFYDCRSHLVLLILVTALLSGIAIAQGQVSEPGAQEQHSGQQASQSDNSADSATDLDDEVIRDVFAPLQSGVRSLSVERVLGIFDKDEMPDYAQVRDQLRAFMDRYESINMRYQLLQVTAQKDAGYAVAEIQMELTPTDRSMMNERRDVQMRFHMKLGPKGWKVIGFRPIDFFAQ